MLSYLKNKSGSTPVIFMTIVMVTMMIMVSNLAPLIIRNIQRAAEMGASDQAQAVANSAISRAEAYIYGYCEGGCNYSDTTVVEENVIYGDYTIKGLSAKNIDEGDDMYYVPIPGYGDAGENCDPDAPGSVDEDCNWNRIDYGHTISVPLYVDGEDQFDGTEFYLKVRTPACDDDDLECSANERMLIACADGVVVEARNGCDYEEDLVVMTWRIEGDDTFAEGDTWTEIVWGDESRPDLLNSEIFTTHINDVSWDIPEDYVVLNIEDSFSGSAVGAILADLLGVFGSMTNPVLKLSFVQTIKSGDGDPLPYLEYQIVTDEPISNDRSFIEVIGYNEFRGDTFYWPKEATVYPYPDTFINYAFQN